MATMGIAGEAVAHREPEIFAILIRSSLTGIKDKGLGFGADDYMTKPFHKDELVARIHAIMRRSKGHAQSVIQTGDLAVNLDTKTVEVNSQRVHLIGKEYQMLELLSLRKGTTLTKEMFLNHLYGGMDEPELKIIDSEQIWSDSVDRDPWQQHPKLQTQMARFDSESWELLVRFSTERVDVLRVERPGWPRRSVPRCSMSNSRTTWSAIAAGTAPKADRACFATRSRACQQNQPGRKNWKKISKLQPTTCSNYPTVSGR
jgi:hypothetical protein